MGALSRADSLEPGAVLLGVDLVKEPEVIERAYNDADGVTAAFNLNLLERIESELSGDLEPDRFRHRALYNQTASRVEMHLYSESDQRVEIEGRAIEIARGESICTEHSYKFRVEELARMAVEAGLRPVDLWTDRRRRFAVAYLEVA